MSKDDSDVLVSVYTTPLAIDAAMVKAMLADEDIPSFVENDGGPFPGISATPCEVMVGAVYEVAARKLIEEHEAQHRRRVDQEYRDATE